MNAAEAIQFAVDTFPAIHQNVADYRLAEVTDYRDFAVYRFTLRRRPAGVASVRVTVRDNRLPGGVPSAEFEVL